MGMAPTGTSRMEPSGAVALAALWQHQGEFGGQRVLITLTGGNVDADRLLRQ